MSGPTLSIAQSIDFGYPSFDRPRVGVNRKGRFAMSCVKDDSIICSIGSHDAEHVELNHSTRFFSGSPGRIECASVAINDDNFGVLAFSQDGAIVYCTFEYGDYSEIAWHEPKYLCAGKFVDVAWGANGFGLEYVYNEYDFGARAGVHSKAEKKIVWHDNNAGDTRRSGVYPKLGLCKQSHAGIEIHESYSQKHWYHYASFYSDSIQWASPHLSMSGGRWPVSAIAGSYTAVLSQKDKTIYYKLGILDSRSHEITWRTQGALPISGGQPSIDFSGDHGVLVYKAKEDTLVHLCACSISGA